MLEKRIYETHLKPNYEHPFIFHFDILEKEKSPTNYHENIEILYFTEGNGIVECNLTHTTVSKGDVFIVNSNRIHCISSDSTLKYYCLIVDNNFLAGYSINPVELCFSEKITDAKLNTLLDMAVSEIWGNNSYKSVAVKTRLLDIFVYVLRNYSEISSCRDKISDNILEAIKFITVNLNSKMNIDTIAAKAGLSKYYFLRQFKKMTDYTVVEYVNLLRCNQAKKMLSDDNLSVKEIGEACGFENFSYFSKTFKKNVGCSPSEYKVNFKEKKL